jgi:hypothetical protein
MIYLESTTVLQYVYSWFVPARFKTKRLSIFYHAWIMISLF